MIHSRWSWFLSLIRSRLCAIFARALTRYFREAITEQEEPQLNDRCVAWLYGLFFEKSYIYLDL